MEKTAPIQTFDIEDPKTVDDFLHMIEHHVSIAENHLMSAMVQLLKASTCHSEAVRLRAFASHPEVYTRLQEKLRYLIVKCRHFNF